MKKCNAFIVVIFILLNLSCQSSLNEIETKATLLSICTVPTDSVEISYDGKLLFKGKVNCNSIIGYAWWKIMPNEDVGVHKIKFKSFWHNSEAEYRVFLEDTLTVGVFYNERINKIAFSTRTGPLSLH